MKKFITCLIAFTFFVSFPIHLHAAEKVSVMLDWFPNVDHVPLYVAQQEKLFADEGLQVNLLSPSDTADALKLVASGNVDIAVAYEPQTIIAASGGLPIRVIGRLIEHPLTTLLFLKDSGIRKPMDLNGKRIGYTVPGMMDLLLEAFAFINGVENYKAINVGFSIVPSLVAKKVDAIMGPYKNYETVQLELQGYEAAYFALEEWGIPDYDELIFVSSTKLLGQRKRVFRSFSKAIEKAISEVNQNPMKSLEVYFRAVPEAPRGMEKKAFRKTLPLYASEQIPDVGKWQAFADFALKYGLINKPLDVKSILQIWDGNE